MRGSWIFLLSMGFLIACPRPASEPGKISTSQSLQNKLRGLQSIPSRNQGPPPLPPELQAMEKRRLEARKKVSPEEKLAREEKHKERAQEAENLLLTADREKKAGRVGTALSLCDRALRRGAGLSQIGYRPQLCMGAIWASQERWVPILQLFRRSKRPKPDWAGFARWQLQGAQALIQVGDVVEAKAILIAIKKHPEVAPEALRALESLERKTKESHDGQKGP